MRRMFASLLFAFTLCSGLVSPVEAVPTNGDFSSGLVGWSTVGDVTADNEEAVVGDDGATYSALWQTIALAPGSYLFEADILNDLSDVLPDPFGFLDTVFATIFFTNDLSNFDPNNNQFGSTGIGVFDLDFNGFANTSATISTSSKGGDWRHVTFGFLNTYNFVVPTFELFAQNGVNADSTVRVDNVLITAATAVVPEPGTLVLLGIGIALAWPYRKK